jgi:rhamnogalacturonan endolyase
MIATPAKFDFGTSTSPVASGYTQIVHFTGYNVNPGYGWNTTSQNTSTDLGSSYSDLQRDYVAGSSANTFKADIASGTYYVTLTAGRGASSVTGERVTLQGNVVDTFDIGSGQFYQGSYRVQTGSQLTLGLSNVGGTGDP